MAQMCKSSRKLKKMEKKKVKMEKKKRKRINRRIERTVSFLAVLVCIAASIAEAVERRKHGGTMYE